MVKAPAAIQFPLDGSLLAQEVSTVTSPAARQLVCSTVASMAWAAPSSVLGIFTERRIDHSADRRLR